MMAVKFNSNFAEAFVSKADIQALEPQAAAAQKTLMDGTGAGNDFLGWVHLPTDYDKEEFARIKKAASYIQKNADVLIVIGIGGSYLGARAVIEALKSPITICWLRIPRRSSLSATPSARRCLMKPWLFVRARIFA